MASIRIKRGTRAQLDAAAAANGLLAGEAYLITDEGRLAVGLSASTYAAGAKQGEGGGQGDPGPGVPAGGASGQVLAKASSTSFDTEWIDPPAGGGGGGGDGWTRLVLSATAETTSTSSALISALSFVPASNTIYEICGRLLVQAAAATTGVRPGWEWPMTPGIDDGALSISVPSTISGAVARHMTVQTDAAVAATAVPGANASYLAMVDGMMITGTVMTPVSGGITLASEISGSAVRIMRGSFLAYREIG